MASMQKSSLRDVVNEVTKEKLSWLENQRKVLKEHYAPILEKYEKPENKASLSFIKEVNDTLKKCPDEENPVSNITADFSVLLNWINPEDPNAAVYFGNKQLIQDTIERLVTHIRNQIEKCEYSCLYANVMTQYMDAKDEDLPMLEKGDDSGPIGSGGDAKSNFRNDKKGTIAEFAKRVVSAPAPEGFSKEAFETLLNDSLFNMEDAAEKKQLLELRVKVEKYCQNFAANNNIKMSEAKLTIAGLIQDEPLGREKTATLKELKENESALTEVCALLNKRMKNYSIWHWPGPVVVNFKRNIAGRYRAYMEEDVLTAILLQYIGAKWSIFLKECFKSIYNSKVWKKGTGADGDRYLYGYSIEAFRRDFHKRSFLTVLPDDMDDLETACPIYDDDDEEEKKVSRNSSGRSAEQTPMEIKQKLLHIISNEIHLNNAVRPGTPLTVVQTDMEWFGPSLIHEVVLSLLKYFGVTEEWLGFFKNFLQAPMRIGFPSAPVQVRKRGAPISHQLTTLFGESLLFVMDLYVNRESELTIHRIHDDFWFWSHIPERVNKAWRAMQTFTKLAGLTLNEEKSASMVCTSDSKDSPSSTSFGPEPLPQRKVQWGFIVLHSDGVFRISDELLEPHVREMAEYLQKSNSVMNWIHGHNKYIRFFIRNFAKPAQTFLKHHIVQIMEKLCTILQQVHPETNGDAVEALKLKYPEMFHGKDVMDSWFHWAVEHGGLGLYNPFLELIPLHEAYRRREDADNIYEYSDPRFGSVLDDDQCSWDKLIEESKERRKKRAQHTPHSPEELEEDTLTDDEDALYNNVHEDLEKGLNIMKRVKRITFETRCQRYREIQWSHWRSRYSTLLANLTPTEPASWHGWSGALYGDQIEGKLGHDETHFVDTSLVPTSLISSMQAERVHNN